MLCIVENLILNPYNNDTVVFPLVKCPQANVSLRAKKGIFGGCDFESTFVEAIAGLNKLLILVNCLKINALNFGRWFEQ